MYFLRSSTEKESLKEANYGYRNNYGHGRWKTFFYGISEFMITLPKSLAKYRIEVKMANGGKLLTSDSSAVQMPGGNTGDFMLKLNNRLKIGFSRDYIYLNTDAIPMDGSYAFLVDSSRYSETSIYMADGMRDSGNSVDFTIVFDPPDSKFRISYIRVAASYNSNFD